LVGNEKAVFFSLPIILDTAFRLETKVSSKKLMLFVRKTKRLTSEIGFYLNEEEVFVYGKKAHLFIVENE